LSSWIVWLVDFLTALMRQPVTLVLIASLPILWLGRWKRIYPELPLVVWALVPCVLSLSLLVRPNWMPLVLAMDVALLTVALFDVIALPRAEQFGAQRECQRIASLRQSHPVALTISNSTPRPQYVSVRDGVPQEFDCRPDEFHLVLSPRSRTTVHYELKAARRGAFELDAVHLRVRSRLGFWQRLLKLPQSSTINVYPDLKQLSEYALLARTNRLYQLGVRRTRRVGQDNEFERLRDYTFDDNYKHIDWRSTARRNRLTVKDYQTNQSQRVMFVVDCGRMMTNQAGGLSLLDHALNSMLMLSYVALERGDAVGLTTFSDRIHSSVPVQGGRNQMNRLLHAAYDRFPQLVESRYEDAFLHFSMRCRKRTLIVLMTNVIDDVNARQIHRYMSLFSGHHLPLAVLLRDPQLFQAMEHSKLSSGEFYRSAAASEILCWRQQVITDLEHRGVLVVDTFPEQLTAPLINRYLDIKARHLL
jgi:uncharacterized protein (DUF58 family)